MLTGIRMKLVGLVVLLAVTPLLNNCAWREGPPCNNVVIKDNGTRAVVSAEDSGATDQALRDRVAELERRLAANESLADSAMMTAQKALDCCRKEYTIMATENIHFDFNRTEIRPGDALILDKAGERLKSNPDLIAELSGFADAVGSPDYNLALGQRRAESARNYLVTKHGINASRISVRTFGESSAVYPPEADVKTREADRRVTIDMLGYSSQ